MTEPNELDKLKYSKSFSQMNSYAQSYTFFSSAKTCIMTFLLIAVKKKTKLDKLNELEY